MEELENKEQVAETTDDGVCTVVDIHFRSGGKTYYFDPAGLSLSAGDAVIIDTARGPEFGTCSSACHSVAAKDVVTPLRRVIRKATEADKKTAAANREKEKRAYSICQQIYILSYPWSKIQCLMRPYTS